MQKLADESIRGYKIVGDRPKDRQLSLGYLQQSHEAAKLLGELRVKATDLKNPAKCLGKADQYSGDELPTDREAQIMCSGCPVLELCGRYRDVAHPAWGVWSQQVRGRNLQKAMEDD